MIIKKHAGGLYSWAATPTWSLMIWSPNNCYNHSNGIWSDSNFSFVFQVLTSYFLLLVLSWSLLKANKLMCVEILICCNFWKNWCRSLHSNSCLLKVSTTNNSNNNKFCELILCNSVILLMLHLIHFIVSFYF